MQRTRRSALLVHYIHMSPPPFLPPPPHHRKKKGSLPTWDARSLFSLFKTKQQQRTYGRTRRQKRNNILSVVVVILGTIQYILVPGKTTTSMFPSAKCEENPNSPTFSCPHYTTTSMYNTTYNKSGSTYVRTTDHCLRRSNLISKQ